MAKTLKAVRGMRDTLPLQVQQYQRIESGQDLKVSTLLRILAGLGLELVITDPVQTTPSQHVESHLIGDNFWSSKHKHLEDE